MSGKLTTADPDVLVDEIIDRYGSIAQFCDVLRRDLDDPTVELPRIPMVPRSTRTRSHPPSPAGTALEPEPPADPEPPAEDHAPATEADRRRGFWRRFLYRWRP